MKDIFERINEALELERELGTRTVDFDRALLLSPPPARSFPLAEKVAKIAVEEKSNNVNLDKSDTADVTSKETMVDVAFWTGSALSAAGEALLDKMIVAMGYDRSQVNVNKEGKARIMVIMGRDALKTCAPGVKAVRGNWIQINGTPAVVTYSPDFILMNYGPDSPMAKAAKKEVWIALKGVLSRLTHATV